MKTSTDYILQDLLAQVESLAQMDAHSIKTRRREREALVPFCWFLAQTFRLRKIKNIAGKHLRAYVQFAKASGKKDDTLMTELSAVRYYHTLSGGRNHLPDNKHLGSTLSRAGADREDRAWREPEYTDFLQVCIRRRHEDYAAMMTLGWEIGLRLHEVLRLDRADVEAALRTGQLRVKGKNGLVRSVPLTDTAAQILQDAAGQVARGQKLFVPPDRTTAQVMRAFQGFISRHRDEVRLPGSDRPMTFHGLRHSYAARTYLSLRASGVDEEKALLRVSSLLGHKRPEITRRYLASIQEYPLAS